LIFFKAEFESYKVEITRLSQEVQEEASLASKQAQKQENELQAIERAEARQNREILIKFKNNYYVSKTEENNRHLNINRRRLERKQFEALNSLSTYNYYKVYKQICKKCVSNTSI